MSQDIEVVFVKEKKGFFKLGQKKNVKAGYARNYLFPFNFAVPNTKEFKTKVDSIVKKATKRQIEIKKEAQDIEKVINNKTIEFQAKVHDETQLYGSISTTDLLEKINKEYKLSLDKHDIKGYIPVKQTGSYKIDVTIHNDITIRFNIEVSALKEEEKKAASKKESKKKTKSSNSDIQTYADEPEEEPETKKTEPSISEEIF
jgi:large subunit ribosomal protein L9